MGVIGQSAGEGIGGVIDEHRSMIWWDGGIILSRKRLGGDARRVCETFFYRGCSSILEDAVEKCLQPTNKISSIILINHRGNEKRFVL